MTTPAIYVASPLGFSEPGRRYLREVLHPGLESAGFVVLDPWSDPTGVVAATMAIADDGPARRDALGRMNRVLGANNAAAIAAADAVLAVLDGSDVDSGTAAEVGYAAGIGVPVAGLRTDFRSSGDNDAAVVNLQVASFVEATGGEVVADLPTAIDQLRSHVENRHLYHLARRTSWEAARSSGTYTDSTRDSSLDEVGFIHTSFHRQLGDTARRHYGDIDAADLVLLTIDRRRLSARLVVELAPGVGDVFPHIYGPLNLDAVIEATPVARDPDGGLSPTSNEQGSLAGTLGQLGER